MSAEQNIKVRFPPSPTGYCHVGTARMAIINYLFAKKHGGTIVFRSEDTDKERSKKEYEDDILEQLHWLGLQWDEFYRTTELVENHKRVIETLIASGKAYVSREESKKEPGTEVEVVRLRNPGKIVTFTDVIRGDISFDTTELDDFVIARAVDDPVYQLAVVIDDAQEGITHVIRGEDHISNTPRHILIQEALGYPRPTYAHYPLLLGTDKSKLSKRTGDVAVRNYRERGFLSEALFNYIALLGWTPPSGREVMSMQEMIDEFALEDLHKSGAVFDIEKLRWYNREYLLRLSEREFTAYAKPSLESALAGRDLPYDESAVDRLMPLLRERVHVSEDARELVSAGELDFFFVDPEVDVAKLPEKKSNASEALTHLRSVEKLLENFPSQDWSAERVRDAVWPYANDVGRGVVLWPFRYALSGKERSPDPFVIACLIGKEATLRRVNTAVRTLSASV